MGVPVTVVREWTAIALFGLLLWTAALGVRRLTKRPLGFVWPVAFAVLIVWEIVLLNALSLVKGVTAVQVLLWNLAAAGVVWAWLRTPLRLTREAAGVLAGSCRRWRVEWMIVPLAVLLALTAYFYPPSTYDSMTYHMGRVAHWIQNRSIEFYPTAIDRQNWMPPGAEYLITILQLVSGTDRWANFVQFFAWLLAICSVPSLCRLAGVPKVLCPWTAAFVAGLPMGVMQATSTQTDMVASIVALAAVFVSVRLLHGVRRWRLHDICLLTIALCAGIMVKRTALLAASPFLLYVLWLLIRQRAMVVRRWRFLLAGGASAVAIAACVVIPHHVRLLCYADRSEITSTAGAGIVLFKALAGTANAPTLSVNGPVYRANEYHGARLFNPILATYSQQTVGRARVLALCNWVAGRIGTNIDPSRLRQHRVFMTDEDHIGNPLHMWAGFALLAALPFAWLALPSRRRWFAAAPFAAWIIFHWFVRDAVWISRTQSPMFFLLPAAWSAVAVAYPVARVWRGVLMAVSVVGLSYAYYCATHNTGKELYPGEVFHVNRDESYYAHYGDGLKLKDRDDAVLAKLREKGSTRLGLLIGLNDYEYPLTWRAMRQGVEVRHYIEPSTWPQLILSRKGVPESARTDQVWRAVDSNGLYEIAPSPSGRMDRMEARP